MENDEVRFRSLIYVNRRVSTSSHRQLPCDHPDLTAVKIWSADTQVLIFSVYIPPMPVHTPDEASAETILATIQKIIQDTLQDSSRTTSLILSGDFNRHHPAWGGNHIRSVYLRRQRIDRLLPYLRPTGVSPPWRTDFLVAEPPGEKLHHRPLTDPTS